MNPIAVVDCSVVMAWAFVDEANDYSRGVLAALSGAPGCVPSVWLLEVGNILLVSERRGRIDREKSIDFLRRLSGMPIEVVREPEERMLGEILTLAREHQLSTYDASYLDLAMRRKIPLATQDKALVRAAAVCGVPLFEL